MTALACVTLFMVMVVIVYCKVVWNNCDRYTQEQSESALLIMGVLGGLGLFSAAILSGLLIGTELARWW